MNPFVLYALIFVALIILAFLVLWWYIAHQIRAPLAEKAPKPLRVRTLLDDYASLRAYRGRAHTVRLTKIDPVLTFVLDAEDQSSADNGRTVLLDSLGRCWKVLPPALV